MVTEIGIHYNNKVSIGMFNSVNVCRSQAKLRLSRSQQNFIFTINGLQLLGYVECAIRTAIINNNYFIIEFAAMKETRNREIRGIRYEIKHFLYLSSMYFTISQMMIGKFSRSLYVGSKIEYLSFTILI